MTQPPYLLQMVYKGRCLFENGSTKERQLTVAEVRHKSNLPFIAVDRSTV